MIKILHVIPSLQKGGAERLVIDICNEINSRKDAAAVIAIFRDLNLYPQLLKNTPVKVYSPKVKLSLIRRSQVDLGGLEDLIVEFKPDIIHSHLFEAEIITHEKLFEGVRYFTHCHDNMPQFRNFSASTLINKRHLTDFYEKMHLIERYRDGENNFIAISQDTKDYFERVLPKDLAKNIVLLNNAINFSLFNSANQKRELNNIRIINVGNFIQGKKNQQFLIDIAEELKKRGLEPEITLLGDGPLHEGIKTQIVQRGLKDAFSMPGNVREVEDFYARANIYVHTATYEPFGLVLLEAMASGLPVIALDGKGNRGLVQDGINGFFITEQKVEYFVDAIMKVMAGEKSYGEFSRNAVDFARAFDIPGYVDRLMQLYCAA